MNVLSGEALAQNKVVSLNKVFPPTAVVNVQTKYGTKGDGKTDDTAALIQAIQENVGSNRTLYFPSGIYLVGKRLEWRGKDGVWRNGLTLQGENRNSVVIRLRDNADGFGDPMNPLALIHTASQPGGPYDPSNGNGFNAFRNYLFDLTVDTGIGNPGATGIDYIANNNGEIGNVTIRCGAPGGHAGLSLTRSPGPCLIKDVTIDGFDYGILANNTQYGITFEHLKLNHQRIVGVRNDSNVLSFRDLQSDNAVPVIQNVRDRDNNRYGLITILDSAFAGVGNAAALSAIDNRAQLRVRGLTTTGYAAAIQTDGTRVPGVKIADYSSDTPRSLFPASQKPPLPVQETPEFCDPDLSHWESVAAHGTTPNDNTDDTAPIQAALDSGKPIIYFPTGRYLVSDTLHVRGAVRQVIGCGSELFPTGPNFDNAAGPRPLLRLEGSHDACVEGFTINLQIPLSKHPGLVCVEQATTHALTLKSMTFYGDINAAYRSSGRGTLFLEDVSGQAGGVGWFLAPGQKVWARQWNPEGNVTMITNAGAALWVLGIKTEGTGTVIETKGGGQTELWGGLLYPASGDPGLTPAFVSADSAVSLAYATLDYSLPAKGYKTQVRETRAGVTKTLDISANRIVLPCYVGAAK